MARLRAYVDSLEKLGEVLAAVFYGLISLAILVVVLGAPGLAFFLLLLGGCTHVLRVGVEDLAHARPAQPASASARGRRAHQMAKRQTATIAPSQWRPTTTASRLGSPASTAPSGRPERQR